MVCDGALHVSAAPINLSMMSFTFLPQFVSFFPLLFPAKLLSFLLFAVNGKLQASDVILEHVNVHLFNEIIKWRCENYISCSRENLDIFQIMMFNLMSFVKKFGRSKEMHRRRIKFIHDVGELKKKCPPRLGG